MTNNTGNKIALVTGSSRGIGRAIALSLARDGYDIIVHCRKSVSEAKAVVAEVKALGKKAYFVRGDITKDTQVSVMFTKIGKFTKKLDLLVNNAGFDYGYLIEDYTMKQARYVLDEVLTSKICVTKNALPLLRKAPYPAVVNISSRMGGPTTIKTVGVYGPAQAGVIKFSQCCALEFAPKIRVNCVAPGMTKTDLALKTYSLRDWQRAARKNPSGRVGHPEDVARAVSFLASEKASYINGETILVTGGSHLN